MKTIHIQITPVSAPRMTRRDKWLDPPRPCVERYFNFANEIELYCLDQYFVNPFAITFHMPMPKSWSKKKKEIWRGKAHLQKPDVDNLLKAVLDASFKKRGDSVVWCLTGLKKVWADEGMIEVLV